MYPVIKELYIKNFKSLTSFTINNAYPYSIFAGANGAGKSNFFDALDFVGTIIRNGIDESIKNFGGFDNIHSVKFRKENARTFEFNISIKYPNKKEAREDNVCKYSLTIKNLDKSTYIEETISDNDKKIWHRQKEKILIFNGEEKTAEYPPQFSIIQFLRLGNLRFLHDILTNLKVYRIDPFGAKEPNRADKDASSLDSKGHNLVSVLNRLEKDEDTRESIKEFMELFVPGLISLQTEHQKLDGRKVLTFKEESSPKVFPAHLVSDGTIYALNLLVAILDNSNKAGITLIEEPERGLHPKLVTEIINLIREKSHHNHWIWITTHNETFVRYSKPEELWFIEKVEGSTSAKKPAFLKDGKLSLDVAWLSNSLGGGLPW